jgi:hypothetical protein
VRNCCEFHRTGGFSEFECGEDSAEEVEEGKETHKISITAREDEMRRYGQPCEFQTKPYQGWASYETWLVALWIDNDRGFYESALEFAVEAPTANEWKAWVEELIEPEGGFPAGLLGDLITAALSEVYWREIAEHYAQVVEENRAAGS